MPNERQPMAREAAGMAEPAAGPDSSASQARKAPSADRITEHKLDCVPERELDCMPAGRPEHPILRNVRMLVNILRHTGFAHITAVFGVLFLFCSLMVWLADPGCLTFGDGMWFSFEAVSTIGFGDIEAAGPIARAATVVLSIFSIFYIALITGVVVNYCSNLIKARQKDTLANFVDSLEHLEEKTPEELAELSARVREYVAKR